MRTSHSMTAMPCVRQQCRARCHCCCHCSTPLTARRLLCRWRPLTMWPLPCHHLCYHSAPLTARRTHHHCLTLPCECPSTAICPHRRCCCSIPMYCSTMTAHTTITNGSMDTRTGSTLQHNIMVVLWWHNDRQPRVAPTQRLEACWGCRSTKGKSRAKLMQGTHIMSATWRGYNQGKSAGRMQPWWCCQHHQAWMRQENQQERGGGNFWITEDNYCMCECPSSKLKHVLNTL